MVEEGSREHDDDRMPLTGHLTDLRKCLIISLIAIGAGFAIAFHFSEQILKILIDIIPNDSQASVVFLSPAEALWSNFKAALFAGIVIALPVVLYELWTFIAPGLSRNERRYAVPFIIMGVIAFFTGLFFCYIVVLKLAMTFLLTYKTANLVPMISVGFYLDFILKFMLAFGLIFELPFVIVFLSRIGLLTPAFLSKNRKYAILINFIVAAVLTPTPDIFNQLLMAGPLILLYEIGIVGARLFGRSRDRASVI